MTKTATKKQQATDNPVERLAEAGFSWFTLGRTANVSVRHMRVWATELPVDRTGVEKVRDLLSLYESMLDTEPDFDPVSLYEEQVVIIELDGEKRYVRLYQFFETGLWDKTKFVEYIAVVKDFFSVADFPKVFPENYETVETAKGKKSIVNTVAIESIGNAELIRRKDDFTML